MAIKKKKQGSKKYKSGSNIQIECYYFDVEKCKHCPFGKLGITTQGGNYNLFSQYEANN